MARPRKYRRISINPPVRFYKPQGIPMRQLRVVSLMEEELEALSLADVKEMDHESAAVLMNVSRPTFSRILAQAHKAVATALVNGAALRIENDERRVDPEEKTSTNMKGINNASNG